MSEPIRVKVQVDSEELRKWAARHSDAGNHGVAHVLYQAAEGVESLTEQAIREAKAEALTCYEQEVREERARQDAKWGEQNHPDGTGGQWNRVARDDAIERLEHAAARGQATWALILKEEVAEVMAESDPARLRAELVQVEAVARSWREAIDRRAERMAGA